ncbi:hemopexin repeat-containing protein [Actinophytocola oryzae]|uniref:Hemopexin n=1 Tax=Actinophytocola oryzae TaxID=502181 RepID=A0A4R7W4Y2_9PSEU|nr:hemopexin repeat-containing protein [Actinophytocola oryzae]TDV57265.1 hemopexin [Actinophytocola oryzae]
MIRDESSPSYAELFGALDFRGDDDARSVYSPAAYFVDLLALLDGTFDGRALLERRPDLGQVLLDAEHTFTETPYLDIVNEVLERLVGESPYDILRKRVHPLVLPFSLHDEEIRKYLHYLQVTPLELYRLFSPVIDHDIAAREFLGLSADDVAVVTTSVTDDAGLTARYGAPPAELRDPRRFAEATGLTGPEVRELMTEGLEVTNAWLDLANRIIRLARLTGLGLTDLSAVVAHCCRGRLDSLRTVAVVVRLHREHGLAVTDVCRLVVPIEDEEVQGCSGDILAARNDDYRFRLANWIEVAEADIATIVRRYREHYAGTSPSPFDQGDVGLAAIGLLRRAGQLASALGVGTDELFDVLVAIDSDPALRRHTSFAVLGDTAPARDCFSILAGGDPAEGLWLAQTLFAVVAWAQAAGFGGRELTEVLGGRPDTDEDAVTALVDGLVEAFDQVSFDDALFTGDRFGERASKVVHDVLTAHDDAVVAPADDRLLRLDLARTPAAAYDAVTDLGVLAEEDFQGLGLGERMRDKLFGNMVHIGHLYDDGVLAVVDTEGLQLASDFEPYRETLFKTISSVVNGTAAFFPSDLTPLGLLPEREVELYDNLVYNGYLDENGDLTDPEFFLDADNVELFEVNADLADATEGVRALIDDRLTRFRTDPLAIDPEIFADLRLTTAELLDLTDSLTFNGYLDENGDYRDKAALVSLPLADFALAIAFYPRRRAVLDAVQTQLRAFQSELDTFTVEDFTGVADVAMSKRVVDALAGPYTTGGRVVDETAVPDLGGGFTQAEQDLVAARIAVVLEDELPYRLDVATLADLGFTEEEVVAVKAHLLETGYVTEALAVDEEWLPYFRNVNNAFSFALPGLGDYAQDVFFALHSVANELTGAVNEVVDRLDVRAAEQRRAVDDVLADAFGIPAETAAAIADAVTGGRDETFDVLVAPALDAGVPPTDPHFRNAYRRIRRFAALAAKLGLDPTEVVAVFRDQDLVGKYPENLTLPPGVSSFDALLEGHDKTIYLFEGEGYWTYAAGTFTLTSPARRPLGELSPRLAGLKGVDAAFTLPSGVEWLVGHTDNGTSLAFTRQRGGTRWAPQEQVWGKVRNNFTAPARIDGAFTDADGHTFLFAGDQYIRYSTPDYTHVDEGYPRPVAEWRAREGVAATLTGPLDAFQAPDGSVHVLTGSAGWGRVRSDFDGLTSVDAAYSGASAVHLFAKGQVVRYSDSIENAGVRVDEGYPRRIHDVPAPFEGGVEAAFTGPDGVLHLFKGGRTSSGGTEIVPTADRWGVLPPVLPSGTVDAAFAGLDGRTYLFSGDSYLRYSTADYSLVDAGYPRTIGPDWGGLSTVDTAFVMDGGTYLFGTGGLLFDLTTELRDDLTTGTLTPRLRNRFAEHGLALTGVEGTAAPWRLRTQEGITLTVKVEGLRTKVFGEGTRWYVRYGTSDYRTPDAGFPKPLSDNWWNMPAGLNLGTVDAVFTGRDGHTYLFAGGTFVRFDARHRWWSEPMSLRENWDSVPFEKVDAAFVGVDGRTYLFRGNDFIRYSTADTTEVDDGYPARVAGHWDNVRNNIQRTGQVDATLVTEVTEKVDGVDVDRVYTYLFSGDQYVRYLGADYARVQPGYPRPLSALNTEPGLAALDTRLDRVDAAFADRRTAYLFSGDRCHAVSALPYRRYDDLGVTEVRCAFIENGSVITNGYYDGWEKRSALENRGAPVANTFRPRTLRTVPAEFQDHLDSVLTGADGNTYLFKKERCFNTQLNHAYPLAEEWGRPRNTIYEQGRVDAAFVGRDGRTYLFSGDQFVVYLDDGTTIDGDPKPIADHWGGLESVALAYVHGEKTYVFEHPDVEGMVRHLVFSGTDYTRPDAGYPAVADDGLLGAPDGFPFPDAVLVEGDTLILLSGEDCVSHHSKTGNWSVVRPIARLFPGFADGVDAPDTLRSAFAAKDGTTYFFFDDTYAAFTAGAFAPLAPTRDRWGLSRNPFVTDGGTVDAAFVWRQYTYLFAGDRYVRYTGPSYRAIDAGYPKKIAVNLRTEEPFGNLPESFEDALDRPISAVVGNDRTINVLVGGVCHTVSPRLTGSYTLEGLGRPRNTFVESGAVDAAMVADRRVYLFSGDQYIRYSTADHSHVDDGYPKPLTALADELGLPRLPDAFTDGVDAAFRAPDGTTYLFRGKEFVRGQGAERVDAVWGRVRNDLTAGGLDAAFVAPTGELYVFRGDQYVRYPANVPLEYVDQGFPRTVKDDWGDLPWEFEEGVDGAFTFEGRAYLTKGERYVRYSGAYEVVDRTYPQDFRHRWAGTADYRLSDLHTTTRFVDLVRSRPEGLAALFVEGADDPYERLTELFGWDAEELRWARRNSGLLTERTPEEQVFEIEFVLALVDLFATARKIGAGPSRLHAEVWSKLHDLDEPALAEASAALYGMLERHTAPAEWPKLAAQAHNELNVLRRDALVAAIAPEPGGSRELFERYLIDVDMGPAGTTSRVREAIAATQLYLHRYLLDLETVTLPADADPDEVRARIKTWWSWMRNYRMWEANRKVFLYPENYLRPELRDTKTPAFAALEDELLRTEITNETAQAAYKRYLDEYTEVSRLAIAGGYVYAEDGAPDGERRLVLFGRTRTTPRRYYYRSAQFRDGEKLSATWEPWLKVDVQIDAERVDPVHAFGRVFVFWPVVEAVTLDDPSNTTITTKPKDGGQAVSAPPPVYQVKIYYSFYNLNREWVPAQLLAVDTEQTGQVTNLGLYVQASRTVPGVSAHDSIIVQCTYRAGETDVTSAFTLTPELYGMRATETVPPPRPADLSGLFDEPATTPIDPVAVVRFNAPADTVDGSWSAVDHKGGSFLCRPVSAPVAPAELTPAQGNAHLLPTTWSGVAAGFQLRDKPGTRYFFDTADKYVTAPDGEAAAGRTRKNTVERFGIVGTALLRTGVVDAVFVRGNQVYLYSGDEYYSYSRTAFGTLDGGFPKLVMSNLDNLPKLRRVDAEKLVVGGAIDAIVELESKIYLLFGDYYVTLNDQLKPAHDPRKLSGEGGLPKDRVAGPFADLGRTVGVLSFDNSAGGYRIRRGNDSSSGNNKDLGRVANAFNTKGKIVSAHIADGKLYLTGDKEFIRYTLNTDGTIPDYVDPGYPKTLAQPVSAVFTRDGFRYVFSGSSYGILPKDQELDTKPAMRPIAGSWRCLPAGFPKDFSGVVETTSSLFFFMGTNYSAYPATDAVSRPYEISALPNEIVRLTSSTAYELNRRLLVGGIDALLAPDTQEIDELPAFSSTRSDATTVRVLPRTATAGVPVGSHLDFDSSNGIYYWEIFFHAPMLIARALSAAQRFDDARRWYEYVFDPTQRERYWRFLPFLAVDVDALVLGCRADAAELADATLTRLLEDVLAVVEPMAPAFRQVRDLTRQELDDLAGLAATGLDALRARLATLAAGEARRGLAERVDMLGFLGRQYRLMGDRAGLMAAYRDDPFDPHAIAALRPAAYRRTVVMAYLDNLVAWADMLFGQYTGESIDEARMLYILAHDLLGQRLYDAGLRALPAATSYDGLDGDGGDEVAHLTANGALLESSGAVHAGVANPYFYVPDNATFVEYWNRVADRLTKIRASLDIMGISRPVPLFEPPADVMALVEGVAKGASPEQVIAALATPLPAYRFTFLYRRAQELAERLKQLGGDLLGAFERRDNEELSLLQTRHEAEILDLTRAIKENQVAIAEEGVAEALASLAGAEERVTHYTQLIATGMSPMQIAQLAMMSVGATAHFVASGLKIGAAIAAVAPQVYIGPFIIGTAFGGDQLGDSLSTGADVSSTLGEAFSMLGEVLGVRADYERQEEDWRIQLASAKADVAQLGHQVTSARLQVAVAQRDLAVLERQAKQNQEISTFLTGKFAGERLYSWMVGQLSGLYFQTYHLAHDMARAAEKAYQFERGGGTFIRPSYWDSQRGGLLAADGLTMDLDRLGQAQVAGDTRGLEITRRVSLLALDPMALLALKNEGRCEFALTEELFDRDFPGHYRRQVRTVSVTFDTEDGPVGVNATLTQLDNKTVLSADPKAVKYLLDPKGTMPDSLRGDWRPSQQIALSDLEDGRDNNGLFELRYDDDRYLPFEGTGAVSRWRLDAGRVPASLLDVLVTVKYTAVQGGDTFATAVKGMLRPYPTARYFDVAEEFPDEWEAFVDGDSTQLDLPITPDQLPGLAGRQITGVLARYERAGEGEAEFLLNGDKRLALADGTLLRTPGLTTGGWTLVFSGDKSVLTNLGLVITYRASVR